MSNCSQNCRWFPTLDPQSDAMTRFCMCLLLLAVGCSQTESMPSNGSTDLGDSASAITAASKDANRDAPPALTVGSPAPPLKVDRFLKGEPVTAFEPGKVYVVEFWATWCGPCIQAMPHVSELQSKYPQVTFIGVNVLEDDDSAAEQFLKARGQDLEYRFARDDVPEGSSSRDGAMAKTWLEAAEVNGIPTAMVVDAHGRIANITHPMSLEECLPQIISGEWDQAAAAKQHLLSVLPDRKSREFNERMEAALAPGPSDKTQQELDRIAEDFPEQAGVIGLVKFRVLSLDGTKTKQALAAGHQLLKGDQGSNPELLNAMAWEIVGPERPKPPADELKSFALEVARKADDLVNNKHPMVADTLARALFVNGDTQAAVTTQRRAIAIAKTNPRATGLVEELQKRLDEYEAAGSVDKQK
ncbi:MAG: redoxin domain-containing protein [Planctomycetes bacterium]|nr:redoxin domain-containing protein [Planctomycetota bacterium]